MPAGRSTTSYVPANCRYRSTRPSSSVSALSWTPPKSCAGGRRGCNPTRQRKPFRPVGRWTKRSSVTRRWFSGSSARRWNVRKLRNGGHDLTPRAADSLKRCGHEKRPNTRSGNEDALPSTASTSTSTPMRQQSGSGSLSRTRPSGPSRSTTGIDTSLVKATASNSASRWSQNASHRSAEQSARSPASRSDLKKCSPPRTGSPISVHGRSPSGSSRAITAHLPGCDLPWSTSPRTSTTMTPRTVATLADTHDRFADRRRLLVARRVSVGDAAVLMPALPEAWPGLHRHSDTVVSLGRLFLIAHASGEGWEPVGRFDELGRRRCGSGAAAHQSRYELSVDVSGSRERRTLRKCRRLLYRGHAPGAT